jgi:hypothetical protein
MKPSIGRIVHYTSYGTPGGEFPKTCRAAVITGVGDPLPYENQGDGDDLADLAVLNPTGMFFNEGVPQDERSTHERSGGTWHWPERVE